MEMNYHNLGEGIKKVAFNIRVLMVIAFIPSYLLMAKGRTSILLPLFFAILFAIVYLLSVRTSQNPWIMPMLGHLLNISIIYNTGMERSPFLFFLLVPIITYGLERNPIWATKVFSLNIFFFVFLIIYSIIRSDIPGLSYTIGVFILSYGLATLITRNQELYLDYTSSLEESTKRDHLTGLYNRRALEEYMDELIKIGKPFILLMCDLDGFKRFNDTYGHQAGDEALKAFANILTHSIRSIDRGFRYGGDEFVIIFLNPSSININSIFKRIKNKVTMEINEIGVSMGLSSFPKDGKTKREIIEVADKLLYEDKKVNGMFR
ncbi:MAG: diguanylate cyclase [bacterium]